MLKSKYITKEDFKEYWGQDLENLIKEDDNPSATTERLLFRNEIRIQAWLNYKTHRNIDRIYPNFTDYQKQCYKFALLEQLMYTIRSGDLFQDSGYDMERGIIIENNKKKDILVCEPAIEQLSNCGLFSRKVKKGGWVDGTWWY